MILKRYIKKLIDIGFVNDNGIVARPRIYIYEGKPDVGYSIYKTFIFFWIPLHRCIDSVPNLEQLNKKYKDIKIVY